MRNTHSPMERIRKIFTSRTIEASGETFVRLYDALNEIIPDPNHPDYMNQSALMEQLWEYGLDENTRKEWVTKSVTNEQWNTIQQLLSVKDWHTVHDFMMEPKKEVKHQVAKLPMVSLPSKAHHLLVGLKQHENDDMTKHQDECTLTVILTMMRTLDTNANMEGTVEEFYSEINLFFELPYFSERSKGFANHIMSIFDEYKWNGTTKSFDMHVDHDELMRKLTLRLLGDNMIPAVIMEDTKVLVRDGFIVMLSALDTDCDLNEIVYSFIMRIRNYQYSYIVNYSDLSFQQTLTDLGWTGAGFLDEAKDTKNTLRKMVSWRLIDKLPGETIRIDSPQKVVHRKINTTDLVLEILNDLNTVLLTTDDIDVAATSVFDVRETIEGLIHMEPIIKFEVERVFTLLGRLGMFTPKEVGSALQRII